MISAGDAAAAAAVGTSLSVHHLLRRMEGGRRGRAEGDVAHESLPSLSGPSPPKPAPRSPYGWLAGFLFVVDGWMDGCRISFFAPSCAQKKKGTQADSALFGDL